MAIHLEFGDINVNEFSSGMIYTRVISATPLLSSASLARCVARMPPCWSAPCKTCGIWLAALKVVSSMLGRSHAGVGWGGGFSVVWVWVLFWGRGWLGLCSEAMHGAGCEALGKFGLNCLSNAQSWKLCKGSKKARRFASGRARRYLLCNTNARWNTKIRSCGLNWCVW